MAFDLGVAFLFLMGPAAFVGGNLLVLSYFRPDNPYADKNEIYECGERPIGDAWIQFNPRFYLVALIFLIFDVEIAFVFPVASVFRKFVEKGGSSAFIAVTELFVFMSVLLLGLVYVWVKGDLQWVKSLAEGVGETDSPAYLRGQAQGSPVKTAAATPVKVA